MADALDAVARGHVDLVYAAALRRTGDAEMARDITQAVFVVLMRKVRAGMIPREDRMAGWLLRVTGYAVKEARRAQTRRRYHEQRAGERANDRELRSEVEDITGWLDASIMALSTLDREVIVRRYLQGQAVKEVAQGLGVSENAVSQRIGRAVEKLRRLLQARGVTASVALAGVLGSAAEVKASPTVLAAVSGAVGAGARHALAEAVARRMSLFQLKVLVVVGAVVVGAAGMWALLVFSENAGAVAEQPQVATRGTVATAEQAARMDAALAAAKRSLTPAVALRNRYVSIFMRLSEKDAADQKLQEMAKKLAALPVTERMRILRAEQGRLEKAAWNKMEAAVKEVAERHGINGTVPDDLPKVPGADQEVDNNKLLWIFQQRSVVPIDDSVADEVVRILNQRYREQAASTRQ